MSDSPKQLVHPGQIIRYEFAAPFEESKVPERPKIIQWNIERAYKLDSIIEILKDMDADIIVLQEIDVYCERSENRNSAYELCSSLQMNGVFVVEFVELKSSHRNQKTQGGGWHGNGILSKLPIKDERRVLHKYMAVDWDRDGHKYKEPRIGRRVAMTAVVEAQVPIQVYSVHLEVFCGIFGRLRQFADILMDCRQVIASGIEHVVVFGDLNTMAHGVARLIRSYCRDEMRWKSLGHSEAQWWFNNLFSVTSPPNSRLAKYCPRHLTADEAGELWNPLMIDAHPQITTLQSYKGLVYKGKLDWTLLRSFAIVDSGTENDHFRFSDHKLLWVIVQPMIGPECAQDAFGLGKSSLKKRRRLAVVPESFPLWIILSSVVFLLLTVICLQCGLSLWMGASSK